MDGNSFESQAYEVTPRYNQYRGKSVNTASSSIKDGGDPHLKRKPWRAPGRNALHQDFITNSSFTETEFDKRY